MPTFELFQDQAGAYRFRLKADNGEIIAASQAYTTKASARAGAEAVKRNAPVASIDDLTSNAGS